jgi:hypothetical protein
MNGEALSRLNDPRYRPLEDTKLVEAAVGSMTVVENIDASVDLHQAPGYSRATIDYYNNIDNYLKLANADENEKTKKKKKANPTSAPDNPILFYV